MKNEKLKAMQNIAGFAAIIAAIVFSITACWREPESEPGPIYPSAYNSIVEMKTMLSSRSANTVSTPYTVKLNVADLGGANGIPTIKEVLHGNPNKYISLIMSGSTFTAIDSEQFKDCVTLTNVDIGTSVTSIGAKAFDGCIHLTTVRIDKGDPSPTTIGDNAFPEGPDGTGGNSLKTAYNTGKNGRYTRPDSSGTTWTKQP